jgi:hypothetical protein
MPKSFVGKMLSRNCYFTAKPMDLGTSDLLYFLNRTVVASFFKNRPPGVNHRPFKGGFSLTKQDFSIIETSGAFSTVILKVAKSNINNLSHLP